MCCEIYVEIMYEEKKANLIVISGTNAALDVRCNCTVPGIRVTIDFDRLDECNIYTWKCIIAVAFMSFFSPPNCQSSRETRNSGKCIHHRPRINR